MAYQNTTDKIQVSVFTNNKKTSEKSPDFSGEVTFPDGRTMEIALWNTTSKGGMPYMRGHIGEKWTPPEGSYQRQGGGNYQPRRDGPNQTNSVKGDF